MLDDTLPMQIVRLSSGKITRAWVGEQEFVPIERLALADAVCKAALGVLPLLEALTQANQLLGLTAVAAGIQQQTKLLRVTHDAYLAAKGDDDD